MKKRLFTVIFLLLSSAYIYSQSTTTLSYRITNPHIIYAFNENADGGNGLECQNLAFDIEIKASQATRYFALGTNLSYNSSALADLSFIKGTLASGLYYTTTVNMNGGNLNVFLTSTQALTSTATSRFVSIPLTYTKLGTFMCRITDPTAVAGIDFVTAIMNGQQNEKLFVAPNWTPTYVNPNIYEGGDLINLSLGRVYSSVGWSQYGGSILDELYIDWTTGVNTTVWEDGAITQTDNTAALATNLYIGNGSATNPVLTIPSNKWLTVSGLVTSPAASSLVVESGGSLLHNNNGVPGTIKRLVTGSSSLTAMMYHFVSVPLTAAALPTSNLFLGSYLYNFVESDGTWHGLGSSTSTPLDVTRGYMMYYPGTSTTNTFAGLMNNGSFTALTTYTGGGYNLVPNPYPSAIGWLTGSWVKTGIDNSTYIWPAGVPSLSGNYASFVGGVGNPITVTQFIPVGQSFLVHANAASPVLTMDNTARVHNAQAFWKDDEIIPNLLRISTIANNATDETVVRFSENATNNFDGDQDAYKLQGGVDAPQLNSVAADNSKLSINSLPSNAFESIVPLNFSFSSATEVTFTASGMESFSAGTPIYLEDQLLNKSVNLRLNPVYTFNYVAGSDINRFRLHFAGPTGTVDPNLSTSGTAYIINNFLYVQVPDMEGQKAQIRLFNALGQQITYDLMVMNGLIQVPVSLSTGVYVVRVTSGSQSFVTKVVKN